MPCLVQKAQTCKPLMRLRSLLSKTKSTEHRVLDIQLDKSSEAVDGLSKTHRLGVEVDFSTLLSGRIECDP